MHEKIYNWDRYLYSNSEKIKLDFSDDGFLDISKTKNETEILEVKDLLLDKSKKYLSILGEIGIGKSSIFKNIKSNIREKINSLGSFSIWINLGEVTSKEDLLDEVLDAQIFIDNMKSEKFFFLFLDSLDEFILLHSNAIEYLTELIKKIKKNFINFENRFYLRVFCRSNYYPIRLNNNLTSIFNKMYEESYGSDTKIKKEEIKQYNISPLIKDNIIYTANEESYDSNKLLNEIFIKSLTSLAMKPITLKLLLNQIKDKNNITIDKSMEELYFLGCKSFCEEQLKRKQDNKLKSLLSPEETLIISSKIAFLLVFSNKYSILKDSTFDFIESDLLFSEVYLYSNKENIMSKEVSITEENINTTLSYGLFSDFGVHRSRFSHFDYAYFLAYWYLKEKNIPVSNILELITYEEELIPQLYNTISWLSMEKPEIFKFVLDKNFEILFLNDISSLNDENKKLLFNKIIEKIRKKDISVYNSKITNQLSKLYFSGILEWLENLISEQEKDNDIKIFAIKVATELKILEFEEKFLDLVLDEKNLLPIREQAAFYLYKVASKEYKLRLLVLLNNQNTSYDLRSIVLYSQNLEEISIEDLFSYLIYPTNNYESLGLYLLFISNNKNKIIELLNQNNLIIALKWVLDIATNYNLNETPVIKDFSDLIIIKGFKNLHLNESIKNLLSKIAILKFTSFEDLILGNYYENFKKEVERNSNNRRVLINEIISNMDENEIVKLDTTILIKDDEDLIYFESIKEGNLNSKYSKLIDRKKSVKNNQLEFTKPKLEQEIEIKNQILNEIKEILSKKDSEPLFSLLPKIFDFFKDNGEINYDITSTNKWSYLTEEIKSSIIFLSKQFLSNITYSGFSVFFERKNSGYIIIDIDIDIDIDNEYIIIKNVFKVFYLLNVTNQNIGSLDLKIWNTWTPFIVNSLPYMTDTKNIEKIKEIFQLSFEKSRELFIETFKNIFNTLDLESGSIIRVYIFKYFWNKEIKNILIEMLDSDFKSHTKLFIISALFRKDVEVNEKYIKYFLDIYKINNNQQNYNFSISLSKEILMFSKLLYWDLLWKLFSEKVDFGIRLLDSLVGWGLFEINMLNKFTSSQMKDLYIWIEQHYKIQDDNNNSYKLKNLIIEQLKNLGEKESFEILEKISYEYDLSEIITEKFMLDAKESMIKNSWKPYEPKKLLEIINKKEDKSNMFEKGTNILHLSDLHFGSNEDAELWKDQLASDITYELKCNKIDIVIISGDLTEYSTKEEYDNAKNFLTQFCYEFNIEKENIILVPGNHDLDWETTKVAYGENPKSKDKVTKKEKKDIEYLDLYNKKFDYFKIFFESVTNKKYSLKSEEEYTIYFNSEENILILGLNSSWELDHHHTGIPSINNSSLSKALSEIRTKDEYKQCLKKFVVFHHPLTSSEDDRIRDRGFLERLAQAGFKIIFHGHIHNAKNEIFKYDQSLTEGRKIDIVCAGTFGASEEHLRKAFPWQYNLINILDKKVTVHTRKKEYGSGAWKPDARWVLKGGDDPLPRYEFNIN